jgi:hypothetical protein
MESARWTRVVPTLAALALAPALLAAQTYPPGNDPRDGLKAGLHDAGEAAKGMKLVGHTGKPAPVRLGARPDLRELRPRLQGEPGLPGELRRLLDLGRQQPGQAEMLSAVECITSQGDPSIVGNLLFVSAEGGGNRKDCGKGGVENPADHMAGVRIYDVSNPRAPRLVKNVETCKGSHTHTVVPHPKNKDVVYLYVSGSQGARPETELAGCRNGADPADTTNSLYRLDVIKVSLSRPQDAAVVTGARIFTDLGPAPTRAGEARRARPLSGADSAMMAQMAAAGPRNCHDVTAYPEMGLLAGACASHGCSSTSRTPRSRSASPPPPTPTSRSGTRRSSATTARRSSSPTSGAAAPRPTARSSTRWRWAATPRSASGPTRS